MQKKSSEFDLIFSGQSWFLCLLMIQKADIPNSPDAKPFTMAELNSQSRDSQARRLQVKMVSTINFSNTSTSLYNEKFLSSAISFGFWVKFQVPLNDQLSA